LDRVDGKYESVTSTVIATVWGELMAAKRVSGLSEESSNASGGFGIDGGYEIGGSQSGYDDGIDDDRWMRPKGWEEEEEDDDDDEDDEEFVGGLTGLGLIGSGGMGVGGDADEMEDGYGGMNHAVGADVDGDDPDDGNYGHPSTLSGIGSRKRARTNNKSQSGGGGSSNRHGYSKLDAVVAAAAAEEAAAAAAAAALSMNMAIGMGLAGIAQAAEEEYHSHMVSGGMEMMNAHGASSSFENASGENETATDIPLSPVATVWRFATSKTGSSSITTQTEEFTTGMNSVGTASHLPSPNSPRGLMLPTSAASTGNSNGMAIDSTAGHSVAPPHLSAQQIQEHPTAKALLLAPTTTTTFTAEVSTTNPPSTSVSQSDIVALSNCLSNLDTQKYTLQPFIDGAWWDLPIRHWRLAPLPLENEGSATGREVVLLTNEPQVTAHTTATQQQQQQQQTLFYNTTSNARPPSMSKSLSLPALNIGSNGNSRTRGSSRRNSVVDSMDYDASSQHAVPTLRRASSSGGRNVGGLGMAALSSAVAAASMHMDDSRMMMTDSSNAAPPPAAVASGGKGSRKRKKKGNGVDEDEWVPVRESPRKAAGGRGGHQNLTILTTHPAVSAAANTGSLSAPPVASVSSRFGGSSSSSSSSSSVLGLDALLPWRHFAPEELEAAAVLGGCAGRGLVFNTTSNNGAATANTGASSSSTSSSAKQSTQTSVVSSVAPTPSSYSSLTPSQSQEFKHHGPAYHQPAKSSSSAAMAIGTLTGTSSSPSAPAMTPSAPSPSITAAQNDFASQYANPLPAEHRASMNSTVRHLEYMSAAVSTQPTTGSSAYSPVEVQQAQNYRHSQATQQMQQPSPMVLTNLTSALSPTFLTSAPQPSSFTLVSDFQNRATNAASASTSAQSFATQPTFPSSSTTNSPSMTSPLLASPNAQQQKQQSQQQSFQGYAPTIDSLINHVQVMGCGGASTSSTSSLASTSSPAITQTQPQQPLPTPTNVPSTFATPASVSTTATNATSLGSVSGLSSLKMMDVLPMQQECLGMGLGMGMGVAMNGAEVENMMNGNMMVMEGAFAAAAEEHL
jgi:hypothetical protein